MSLLFVSQEVAVSVTCAAESEWEAVGWLVGTLTGEGGTLQGDFVALEDEEDGVGIEAWCAGREVCVVMMTLAVQVAEGVFLLSFKHGADKHRWKMLKTNTVGKWLFYVHCQFNIFVNMKQRQRMLFVAHIFENIFWIEKISWFAFWFYLYWSINLAVNLNWQWDSFGVNNGFAPLYDDWRLQVPLYHVSHWPSGGRF